MKPPDTSFPRWGLARFARSKSYSDKAARNFAGGSEPRFIMSDSLAGFRVIDLSEGICGPFCSMQLADAGAEVIKVEPPEGRLCEADRPTFCQR